jgi:hypothetical protein
MLFGQTSDSLYESILHSVSERIRPRDYGGGERAREWTGASAHFSFIPPAMLSNSLCRATLRSGLSRSFLRPQISCSKILQTRRSFSESVPAQPTNHAYDDVEVDDVPDFGAYSIILPPEPFVFGTDHIVTRNVPAHIPRPPYVGGRNDGLTSPPPVVNTRPDGRMKTEDPEGLRKAASLACEVLAYAGTLVQVSHNCCPLRVLELTLTSLVSPQIT